MSTLPRVLPSVHSASSVGDGWDDLSIVSAEMGKPMPNPASATVTLGLRSRDGQQELKSVCVLSNSGYSLAPRRAKAQLGTLPRNRLSANSPQMDRRLTAGIVRATLPWPARPGRV